MKIVNLIPMGLLSVMLMACTNETDLLNSNASVPDTYYKKPGTTAGNEANPYDDVGESYRNALSLYKANNSNPNTYPELINIINDLLGSVSAGTSDTATQQFLASCMNAPDAALEQILQAPSLSASAVTILSDFFYSYNDMAKAPFGKAYNDITAIENSTLSSIHLSVEEQRIILAVMSITRYSLYHSCCEDTDWGKSVGNIIAALGGALESNQVAMEYSLLASIAGLEKIQL